MSRLPEPEIQRDPALQEDIDEFRRATFGRDGSDGCCVSCGSNKTRPEDFRDDLSRREWRLSLLCQQCQDDIFGG